MCGIIILAFDHKISQQAIEKGEAGSSGGIQIRLLRSARVTQTVRELAPFSLISAVSEAILSKGVNKCPKTKHSVAKTAARALTSQRENKVFTPSAVLANRQDARPAARLGSQSATHASQAAALDEAAVPAVLNAGKQTAQ